MEETRRQQQSLQLLQKAQISSPSITVSSGSGSGSGSSSPNPGPPVSPSGISRHASMPAMQIANTMHTSMPTGSTSMMQQRPPLERTQSIGTQQRLMQQAKYNQNISELPSTKVDTAVQSLRNANRQLFQKLDLIDDPRMRQNLIRKIHENNQLIDQYHNQLEQQKKNNEDRFAKQKSSSKATPHLFKFIADRNEPKQSLKPRSKRLVQQSWDKFVDTHFNYSVQNKDITEFDRTWHSKFCPEMFTNYDHLQSTEREVIESTLRSHVFMMMRSPAHALHRVLTAFVSDIRHKYSRSDLFLDKGSVVDPQLLSDLVSDWNVFLDHILARIMKIFPTLDNDIAESFIAEELQRFLLNEIRNSPILDVYHKAEEENDLSFSSKVAELTSRFGTDITPRHFEVSRKFHNVDFDAAMEQLDRLLVPVLVNDSIAVVLDTMQAIVDCIQTHFGPNQKEQIAVGADDMLPLLGYVLLRTQNNEMHHRLPSFIRFLEDFTDEAVLRGNSGYALISLQSAMELIRSMTAEEMQANYARALAAATDPPSSPKSDDYSIPSSDAASSPSPPHSQTTTPPPIPTEEMFPILDISFPVVPPPPHDPNDPFS